MDVAILCVRSVLAARRHVPKVVLVVFLTACWVANGQHTWYNVHTHTYTRNISSNNLPCDAAAGGLSANQSAWQPLLPSL